MKLIQNDFQRIGHRDEHTIDLFPFYFLFGIKRKVRTIFLVLNKCDSH